MYAIGDVVKWDDVSHNSYLIMEIIGLPEEVGWDPMARYKILVLESHNNPVFPSGSRGYIAGAGIKPVNGNRQYKSLLKIK